MYHSFFTHEIAHHWNAKNLALENSSHDPFEIYKEVFKLPLQTDAAVLKVFEKYTSEKAMKEIYSILEREK